MTKTFCDVCGEEMKSTDRLRVKQLDVTIECIHMIGSTYNAGAVCHACVREIVLHGKVVK